MRANTGIRIARFCLFSIVLLSGVSLQAQRSPSAIQPVRDSVQDATSDLSVAVGKTILVDFTWPIKRVAVAIGGYAEVHAVSPSEIMVNGKAAGETSLIVWDTRGGRQFFNLAVYASSSVSNYTLEGVRRELKREFPAQTLKVSSESGSIFLRGTVKDLNSSERAVKIASTAGTVVNLLKVDVPASEPQILLKVRFLSVDRTREKQLGINFFNNQLGNSLGSVSTGQFNQPVTTSSGTTITNDNNIMVYFPGLGVGATIEALETKIGAQTLAEPNLLAANGKQASFLAGGQYPYPVVQGGSGGSGSSVTLEFKEYGVRLNFIPTITPRNTIRLQVAPEVSALDYSDAIQISGFTVPAITTRKMNTEVELADGQSFVIGGLLDNTVSETFNKIPFLGDIPVLGKFFQSMQRTKANTELIVIVTPEIVAPIPVGEPLPDLKFPYKIMEPNSKIPMHTPDAKTSANTMAPAPPNMPVEKLVQSMKAQKPLVVDGGSATFGAASGGTSSGVSADTSSH